MKKIVLLVILLAACSESDGKRCNPLQYSNNGVQGNCDTGYECVYPTSYPSATPCGVAYCCAVDESGKITDTHPSCQPDTSLASACMLDFSSIPGSSPVTDSGASD